MCGIIAVISKKGDKEAARETLLEQYEAQYSRGTKGFGLVEITKDTVRVRRATESTKALIDVVRSDASILLFHHRFPTSTDNNIKQTHPIVVSNKELKYDWLILHNGVIVNAVEIKKDHDKLEYEYTTNCKTNTTHSNGFNDSEAFAIELARFMEGKADKIKTRGATAFIGVKLVKKTQKPIAIFWGRGPSNPMQIYENENLLILASDIDEDRGIIYDQTEETISTLTIKVISDPSLWAKKNEKEGNLPLADMATLEELQFEKYVAPIESTSYSYSGYINRNVWDGTGYDLTRSKTIELQSKTKEDKNNNKKDIRYSELPNTESPRMIAFYKMADRVSSKVASLISCFFEELAENDLTEEDLEVYMIDIGTCLKEKMKIAERARFHFDKFEDNQTAIDMARLHNEEAELLGSHITDL